MRSTKVFSLVALTGLATMAFIGASLAEAESTALCKHDEDPCKATIVHAHLTTKDAKATLLTSVLDVECDALVLADAETALASPLTAQGEFTYSNCNSSCTLAEENGPAEINVLKSGAELANVSVSVLLHLVCGFFLNCRYVGENLEGHARGPLFSTMTNGEGSLSEQTMAKESGFCPSTAQLDIVATPLEPIYITK